MTWKLVAAATMRYKCHQDGIDVSLKPEDADSDREDMEPLDASTIFWGKEGLISGVLLDKKTLLDADIIAAAKYFYR